MSTQIRPAPVRKSIRVAAPPERAFEVFTCFKKSPICVVDPCVVAGPPMMMLGRAATAPAAAASYIAK